MLLIGYEMFRTLVTAKETMNANGLNGGRQTKSGKNKTNSAELIDLDEEESKMAKLQG